MNWHMSLGIPAEKYRFHDHVKLAHYAELQLAILNLNFQLDLKKWKAFIHELILI